ncbi:MAG: lytic murein transglycosylase [Methylococcales bacterium]|nr:lytic murein transglycosylase [Methylococcales bacterium]
MYYKGLPILSLLLLISACTTDPVIPPSTSHKDISRPIVPLNPTKTHTQRPKKKPSYPKRTPKQVGHYSSNKLYGDYASSSGAHNFIRKLSRQHGFSEDYLRGVLSKAKHLNSVFKLEKPTLNVKKSFTPSRGSWSRYRKKFIKSSHINNGVTFWRKNARTLERASKTYRVDPEYIVAIIGVETFFGRNVGRTRTLDALSTLAFHTKRRSKYFTSELENFLLMTKEQGYDPQNIVGSWAGAMGLGQFMPSSFRKLAVDFDNDGKRDLWNPTDAIGSVANYFSHHHWRYKKPVTTRAYSKTNAKLFRTYSEDQYWTLHPNFKVIKKYNHSNYYAMAVHQLAQAIKRGYQR